MKKIIFVVIMFFITLGLIEMWGVNIGSMSVLCITVFMAGLFIGQRQGKRA